MKNTSKIYVFLGLIALVAGIMLWVSLSKPKAFEVEKVDVAEELSDRNIVSIQVDSLTNIIRQVYGNDATVSANDSENYVVKIQNQGNEISNFYNDNPRLLETKDERFSIKRIGSRIEATFKTESIKQQKYVFVPTDVVYKLSELAYNK
ncbi:hypothetical protein [Emticicia sp. C21]|uniref:hypothetical protein n=1 Tax=Emticicia sp. C21 TaxID=2302915 RepID=UPI000E345A40|nr:hypothetical protein [Emticicia sp. C21]RFS18148.1 hypothetical protein D0T08_02570 [Emticicia sp. C21]